MENQQEEMQSGKVPDSQYLYMAYMPYVGPVLLLELLYSHIIWQQLARGSTVLAKCEGVWNILAQA